MSKILVDTIDTRSGTSNITIGSSNASQITLKSGATLTNFPNNTPSFYGELASAQVVSRATVTKITGMTQNEIDTNTAFDGTTFTVPSGQAGKYYIFCSVFGNFSDSGNDGSKIQLEIYKNGSSVREATYSANTNNLIIAEQKSVSAILDLSVGDTIEMYVLLSDDSAGSGMKAGGGGQATHLGGYKIIGA
mgnify:CR=1 FL=1